MRKQVGAVLVATTVLLVAVASLYAGGLIRSAPREPVQPRTVQKPAPRIEAIAGHVIDAEGHPVADAEVFAELTDALTGISPSGRTDDQGAFRIEVGKPGTYKVFGSKEEAGYPLTVSGFHQEVVSPIPTVTVAPDQVVSDVVVRFGSKAASIEGFITDAATNRVINKATITLRRADNPDLYYIIGPAEEQKGGKFKALAPPMPITIEVSAVGYETWAYSDDGLNKHPDSLKLKRGETKKLIISLRKKHNPEP